MSLQNSSVALGKIAGRRKAGAWDVSARKGRCRGVGTFKSQVIPVKSCDVSEGRIRLLNTGDAGLSPRTSSQKD